MATILVVDDERLIRQSMHVLLSQLGGHDIETAANAREAWEIADRKSPDLLIVDWMLANDMDGLQVAKSFRESNPSLPVILITGYLSDDLQARVGSLPRTWVLPKPCEFSELERTIKSALASSLIRRE